MREVDFFKLSRPVQDHFVASARGKATPVPLLYAPVAPRAAASWLGLVVAGAATLGVLCVAGHGSLTSAASIHGWALAPAYVAPLFLMVFSVLRAAALRREARRSPYRPGVYLFPGSLVDARRSKLRVHSLTELTGTAGRIAPPSLVLTFGSVPFAFPADAEQSGAVERALVTARADLDRADAAADPRAMAALDPLYVTAFSSPVGPTEPMRSDLPAWARAPWAAALVSAGLLGPLLLVARNASSDERMFARAAAADTTPMYRHYLERGQRHRAEVEGRLLPRSELREATRVGSVAAIERFQAEHPGSKIEGEVDTALRTAMLAELDAARKGGTLAALRDFAARHPTHHVEGELKQAQHAVYTSALDRWRARAPEKDAAAVAAFIERLLATLEAGGPRVEVRFRRKVSKSMAKGDAAVSKHKSFTGSAMVPSRWLTGPRLERSETAFVQQLAARFAEVFPQEILAFERVAAIEDPEVPIPASAVPALLVEQVAEWSGTTYPVKEPRGVFAGAIFKFDGTFKLPDAGVKPLHVRLELWRPADVAAFKDAAKDAPARPAKGEDPPEAKVYDAMLKDAFEQYARKVGSTFVKAPPRR